MFSPFQVPARGYRVCVPEYHHPDGKWQNRSKAPDREMEPFLRLVSRSQGIQNQRNASRDFFEALVRADSNLEEIYQRADRLNLDIVAEAYNILIFSPDTSDSSCNSSEGYSDWEAEVHNKIENYFLSHPVWRERSLQSC